MSATPGAAKPGCANAEGQIAGQQGSAPALFGIDRPDGLIL
jgi:hypothetical protein